MLEHLKHTSPHCQSAQPSTAYQEHVEAMRSMPVASDDLEPLKWPVASELPLHVQAVRRYVHRGRQTVHVLCGPGLMAAIPEARALTRNPMCPGTSAKSRRWTDAELIDRWCGVMVHRGRGLTEHDETIIAEMRARAAWLPGMAAASMPAWLRSRLSDRKIPPVAAQILAFVLRSRELGRIGLDYSNHQLASMVECEPRSVRRAIAWLEARAIVWRHATVRPGLEEGDRPIDQDRNLLLPGPRWMREVDAWAHATPEERDEMGKAGRARYRRRRAARAASRSVELEPATIEEWTEEELAARREQEEIVGELRWVEQVESREVARGDAKAVAAGEMTPSEALERESHREAAREELAAKVVKIHGRYSRETIDKARARLSSNWEDRKSSQSPRGLNPPGRRSPRPDTRSATPQNQRRDRDTSPPVDEHPASMASEIADVLGLESRASRGGDWYDRRFSREADRPEDHRNEPGQPESERGKILEWADRWSQSAKLQTKRRDPTVAKMAPTHDEPDGEGSGAMEAAAARAEVLERVNDPKLAELARGLFSAHDRRSKNFFFA